MAKKEYTGKIKYLGDTSTSQLFKAAIVSLSPENGKLYLETRLACDPSRLYRYNEITNTEAIMKSGRLIVKYATKHNFWELHFVGEGKHTNQMLFDEIQTKLKAVSKIHHNKAEVGCGKKTDSVFNGRLFGVSPKTQQELPQHLHVPSNKGRQMAVGSPDSVSKIHHNKAEVGCGKKTDSVFNGQLFGVSSKTQQELPQHLHVPSNKGRQMAVGSPGDRTHLSPTVGSSGSSPCFTRVKENKRQNGETKKDLDDDSKENQHRGPVNQVMNQQNQGDRKPLKVASFRFYGAASQKESPITDYSSSNGFFKMTKSRPVSGPLYSPDGRKGQFSEIVKTYSWNHSRKNTLATAVKNEMPPLQGFANLGNTCYMNAILQSLFVLETFSVDLHSVCKHYSKALTRHSLAVALTRLMLTKQRPPNSYTSQKLEELLHSVKRAISATAKRFIGSQQHDAHEFLCQVLDQLKEEVIQVSKPKEQKERAIGESETLSPAASPESTNTTVGASGDSLSHSTLSYQALVCRTPPRPSSMSPTERLAPCDSKMPLLEQSSPTGCSVNSSPPGLLVNPTLSNFEFDIVHSFRCINCQEQIQKAEQFNDLSVDIPKNDGRLPGITLSLQDALDIFFRKEEIDYRCEKCGHTKAEVMHKFAKLPRILIVHLKRYTYNQWNNKTQEKIQLPRYLTLQDHCDASTVPHLPYHIMQINSPMKSPVLSSPVRQPTSVTPDYRQRRRRMAEENGMLRGHKKVRRSLLAEVHGDVPASDKASAQTSLNSLAMTTKSDGEKQKPEVITVDIEADDADLQRAIDLSLQEYQASQTQSDHEYNMESAHTSLATNNNGPSWPPDPAAASEDDGKVNVLNMSYEKQLELAIRRSLAPCVPQAENGPEDMEHSDGDLDHPPLTDPAVFKKPLSAPRKENKRKDGQTLMASGQTPDTASASELDMSILGVRNFTSASDFMHDTDIRTKSPDGSGGDNGVSDCGDRMFTSCRSPCSADRNKNNVSETGETSSGSVSTNIGSLGALSKVSSTRRSDYGTSSEEDAGQRAMMTVEKEELQRGRCTPVNSPCSDSRQDGDFTKPLALSSPWTPEEDKQISEAFSEDWANTSESSDVFSTGVKGGAEEKENLSPETDRGWNETFVDLRETPLDKESEAKQLQHRLRQTEIEKGMLPHSYRLVSIVNHHGETSSFGHYVSDVFDMKKQSWFSFDDRHVEKTTEAFVRTRRTSSGYIFFYLSKDIFDDLESSRPGGNGKELIERL